MGFRAADMFTPRLTAGELVSIVMAAPTNSAIRYSFDEGFTPSDHYLATLSEQYDGLVRLGGRHQRPGVDAVPQGPTATIDGHPADVLSIADFEARRARLIQRRKANG